MSACCNRSLITIVGVKVVRREMGFAPESQGAGSFDGTFKYFSSSLLGRTVNHHQTARFSEK
jgi:hypothetical protein